MWILPLVGYVGAFVGFGFLTLAIASGLYYLSELVEEHTVLAKRFLTRLIQGIIALQLILCVIDRFPFWQTLLGIFAHVVYLGNMRRFPYVQLTDPLFLLSCGEYRPLAAISAPTLCKRCAASLLCHCPSSNASVLVLLDHYVWFRYFSTTQQRAYMNMSSYYDSPKNVPTFTQIASYFGICVWLVPFALFVSLSASDNVLPTMGLSAGLESSAVAGGIGGTSSNSSSSRATKRGQGMAKALVDSALSIFGSVSAAAGMKRPEERLS